MNPENPNAESEAERKEEAEANHRLILDALAFIVGPEEAAEHERRFSRIIPAPEWLKRRMEASRRRSKHVTLDEVRRQMQASAEHRRVEGVDAWFREQYDLYLAGKRPPISQAEYHEQVRLGAERIRRWQQEQKSALRRTCGK